MNYVESIYWKLYNEFIEHEYSNLVLIKDFDTLQHRANIYAACNTWKSIQKEKEIKC